ncbi:hypothetical protein CPJCM30710_24060 [Clostridium polyendosporum]|uniref:Uncharacterized protein n=1 Tax=Clostridium polyendosporum TaxID=69208 RepID=A0A919S1Z1_9CLOT|nr:hypothetical protein [Clostridium polyendosporum]GIM29740.1 hypothetical protein CPJCM30710_24060 [Clostridium polyendosporum]
MIFIVFSANDEGFGVELTTENLDKAIEKFKEDEENYTIEVWNENEDKIAELNCESDSNDSIERADSLTISKYYYLDINEEDIRFENLDEVIKYLRNLK